MKVILNLMLFNVLVVSCGSQYIEYCEEQEPRQQQDDEWKEVIKPIVDARCTPCHDGAPFVGSGKQFKASAAKSQIESGLMPPPGSQFAKDFTLEEQEALLDY